MCGFKKHLMTANLNSSLWMKLSQMYLKIRSDSFTALTGEGDQHHTEKFIICPYRSIDLTAANRMRNTGRTEPITGYESISKF